MINHKSTKTIEIVLYLLDLINNNKIAKHQVLPSEHYLINKFKCSRSIVINAYKKLEAIGAVYSISKKGYYRGEHYHNQIKPLSYLLDCEKTETIKVNSYVPDWFENWGIVWKNNYFCLKRKYLRKKKIVMIADYFVNETVNLPDDVDNISIIDLCSYQKGFIDSIAYKLKYEKVDIFNQSQLVVIYMIGSYKKNTILCARYIVDPEYFKFEHQEFNIFIN